MKYVVLSGKSEFSELFREAFRAKGYEDYHIVEDPPSKRILVRRRIRKLGLLMVIDQILFLTIVPRILKRLSRIRRVEILRRIPLEEIPQDRITYVANINHNETLNLLERINPDLVFVFGTRIISSETITNIGRPLINVHFGITPYYRGVHGAYWSLRLSDRERCGVTLHYIDQGIDTGGIIIQDNIIVTDADNFYTYGLLQLEKSLKLIDSVDVNGDYEKSNRGHRQLGRLFYHPGITDYLYYRFFRGVK